ncbi:hypothetical protein ACO1O0_000424 [Amphichorda felina]
MPSTRATILAVTLAVARLSAAAPLAPRGPVTFCAKDEDCGPYQVCGSSPAVPGEMGVAAQACVEMPNVDVRSDRRNGPEPLEEGKSCNKDSECRDHLKCQPDQSTSSGGMDVQVFTCQGEMNILPVNTRNEPLEEGKSCNKDTECRGNLKCQPDQSTSNGGMDVQVFTCQGEMNILPINTRAELLEEGKSCNKDTECRGNLKCQPDQSTSNGGMDVQVFTCQAEMNILPINTRAELLEEKEICNADSECQEDLKCLPDPSVNGKPTVEILTCQSEMNILPVDNMGRGEGFQPEADSPCTGLDDKESCPHHQICLPAGKTRMFKCQDKV